jgi:HD-GYP domain-containing protein (c-di-GMP phosphodiesterase class II)
MVRLSDILKKRILDSRSSEKAKPEEKKEPAKEEPIEATPSPQTPAIEVAKAMTPQESHEIPKPQDMQIAKAMKELRPDIERSKTLYSKGVHLIEDLLRAATEKKPIELQAIKDLVEEFVNGLVLQDKVLFSLFHEDYPPKDYLYNHMVNVMIMSLEVGLGLGYNKSQLDELGLAAFLHDIGMIKVNDIARQPRALSEEEFNQIKEHPVYGASILSQFKNFPQAIVYAVQEEHERFNGKGYPNGIKDGDISEYARIIATVDVYEALTHDRVYRKRYTLHEGIKEMLSSGSVLFDTRLLKILVDRVGIYPIGSWVELNTNEIGKVITINDELPLRPVVSVIFDSTGSRLEEPRVVNLVKQFNIFIKRPLSDEEVLEKVKEEVKDEESQ